MNTIGIIGAMEEEVKILKNKMEVEDISEIASMEFYKGKLKDRNVVVVRSGIGKVNAALCTQILIDRYNVDAVVNTGIAGSLKAEINIGDIVISSDALQHDVDATGFGYPKGDIPRMDTSIFKADDRLIDLAKLASEATNEDIQVFIGRVVTGDQFISDNEKKHQLIEDFKGYCTEMEGAAIAQACYLNNIPFVIIRAISDKADNSAEMSYNEFEAKAVLHSTKMMELMLEKANLI